MQLYDKAYNSLIPKLDKKFLCTDTIDNSVII